MLSQRGAPVVWLGSCSLCMGLEFSQAKHDMLPKCGSVDDTATAYIEFILPRTMMRTDAFHARILSLRALFLNAAYASLIHCCTILCIKILKLKHFFTLNLK